MSKSLKGKVCGNCKYFLRHRLDKKGFNGKCKEIVIKEDMTNVLESINLFEDDKACDYFQSKAEDI